MSALSELRQVITIKDTKLRGVRFQQWIREWTDTVEANCTIDKQKLAAMQNKEAAADFALNTLIADLSSSLVHYGKGSGLCALDTEADEKKDLRLTMRLNLLRGVRKGPTITVRR